MATSPDPVVRLWLPRMTVGDWAGTTGRDLPVLIGADPGRGPNNRGSEGSCRGRCASQRFLTGDPLPKLSALVKGDAHSTGKLAVFSVVAWPSLVWGPRAVSRRLAPLDVPSLKSLAGGTRHAVPGGGCLLPAQPVNVAERGPQASSNSRVAVFQWERTARTPSPLSPGRRCRCRSGAFEDCLSTAVPRGGLTGGRGPRQDAPTGP